MNDKDLQGLQVAILVTDDFEEVELAEPKKALEEAGAVTKIIAPHNHAVQAMKHDQKADTFPVDEVLGNANPEDYDVPGGALNADALRINQEAQSFVEVFEEDKKPIAFICHAPWLLVSSDLVNGRTLTSYHTIQDDIRNAGGNWADKEVVRDDNWVSSRQPTDIPAFNKEMIKLFKEHSQQQNISEIEFLTEQESI